MNPLFFLSHFLALLLPFLLLLRASPEPAPAPAIVSLPARQPQFATGRLEHGRIEEEHDLLSFVLVSTIDGGLHAIEREDGKVKWSLNDGVEPLVGGGVTGKGMEEFIVEPLTGGLYVFEDEDSVEAPKIRKLPLTVEQLINISPFTFRESPSRIFTGSKQTSLLALDLRTGEQLDFFSSHNTNLSRAPVCENDQLLDDMDRSARSNRDTLFVGRTDYRLVIHSQPHHDSSASQFSLSGQVGSDDAEGVQEIVYSTYTPNSYDKPLAEYWAKTGADQPMREKDGSLSKRVKVELWHDGTVSGLEGNSQVKWSTKLDSVGIAVYDILMPLSHASANPILVPQPPSTLGSVPAVEKQPARRQQVFGRLPSTFIGSLPGYLTLPPSKPDGLPNQSTEGTTSEEISPRPLLYALSSESYPLVSFAPPPIPGSLADGSFVVSDELPYHEQLLPYLLDPPAEDKVPAVLDHKEVDEAHMTQQAYPFKSFWWIIGVFCSLLVLGGTVTRWHRQSSMKESASPVAERSPLLEIEKPVILEKAVPVIESTESAVSRNVNGNTSSLEEIENTPKKRSNRRRVRGKKKKDDAPSVTFAVGGDDDDEDDRGDGSSGSSPRTSPPTTVLKKDEKPLPDLPRVITATDLVDPGDVERLKVTDIELGRGSHGTVVYRGSWGDRPVAVKRLLSDFTQLASREVKLLQASDDHANVIRYYCQERRDNFLYIALDLCDASLADLIESPNRHVELASALDRRKALTQITHGVKHLHDMKIIHRDIKPQNVLVSRIKDGSLRMMVSDFGLARQLDQGQSSFAPTANNHAGSLGWRAPECIKGDVRLGDVLNANSTVSSSSSSASLFDLGDDLDSNGKGKGNSRQGLTKAVDLFALGCLYFWVLMNGEHPFGEAYDRESNIVKGEVVNMTQLDVLFEEGVEAKDLIGRMLSTDPTLRPETGACLIHPFFWTPAKRLAFLCDASDRFEIMELDPPESTLVTLETDAVSIVGKDWYSRLDKVFINNLGKYRKYKGNSVRDLLRAMRNKKHHYQDLEPAVKRHLGNLPHGFLHYFTSRYPNLFLHVHGVVRDSRLRHESMFEGYFIEGG